MTNIKPISPEDFIFENKLPEKTIFIINFLIKKNWDKISSAIIEENELVTLLAQDNEIKKNLPLILRSKLIDKKIYYPNHVIDTYKNEGWFVYYILDDCEYKFIFSKYELNDKNNYDIIYS